MPPTPPRAQRRRCRRRAAQLGPGAGGRGRRRPRRRRSDRCRPRRRARGRSTRCSSSDSRSPTTEPSHRPPNRPPAVLATCRGQHSTRARRVAPRRSGIHAGDRRQAGRAGRRRRRRRPRHRRRVPRGDDADSPQPTGLGENPVAQLARDEPGQHRGVRSRDDARPTSATHRTTHSRSATPTASRGTCASPPTASTSSRPFWTGDASSGGRTTPSSATHFSGASRSTRGCCRGGGPHRPQGRVDRQILAFDPGRSSLVELIGDLDTANNVGVLVPGMNTTIEGSAANTETATRFVQAAPRRPGDDHLPRRPVPAGRIPRRHRRCDGHPLRHGHGAAAGVVQRGRQPRRRRHRPQHRGHLRRPLLRRIDSRHRRSHGPDRRPHRSTSKPRAPASVSTTPATGTTATRT